jgi:hypothetical protein
VFIAKQGGLTAITTGKTTIIVGRTDFFDEDDFRPLVEQLDLPTMLSSKAWDYAETSNLILWSVTRD